METLSLRPPKFQIKRKVINNNDSIKKEIKETLDNKFSFNESNKLLKDIVESLNNKNIYLKIQLKLNLNKIKISL